MSSRARKCARQSAAVRAKKKNDRYLERRVEIAEKKGEYAGTPLHTHRRQEDGARVWAF